MNEFLRTMGLLLALAASGSVQAETSSAEAAGRESLRASEAWIRPAPPAAPVRAGYVELSNPGKREVVIDAVRSDAFGAIQIHEMHEVDGVMRMRPVKSLTLAPGQTRRLEPGGLHLMLFRPISPLAEGDVVEVVFAGPDGDVARAGFTVREPAS